MDGYSRLIAWLRVVLPLMALAILSTLFLVSRSTEPATAIPFAESDIRDRLQSQQITRPVYSGTTSSGTRISFSAAKILTEGKVGENDAEDISAHLDLAGGTRVTLLADRGTVSMSAGEVTLEGDVHMETSTGFVLNSAMIEAATAGYDIRSPGPVVGTGPFGRLDAGAMIIDHPDGEDRPHLLFTNGVRLVYQPQDVRE